MIMPNKNIRIEYSLLNCGALLLEELHNRDTISSLWEKSRTKEPLINYEKFILTLDYLFTISAIQMKNGLLVRSKND